MFAYKSSLLFLAFTAFQAVLSYRIVRSPDKMELNLPNQSFDRESGEYQNNMKDEASYWQGQGDKYEDQGKEGHGQLDEDREKNKENYEHEKEHFQEQQQEYNKEMNNTYQEDRDKAEAHHHDNQEHLHDHHDNANHANSNHTVDDLHMDNDTGDRYEEKGTEYINDREGQMENYEMEANAPSFTYTRD